MHVAQHEVFTGVIELRIVPPTLTFLFRHWLPCQKSPSTKIANRFEGNTMSGFPDKSSGHILN